LKLPHTTQKPGKGDRKGDVKQQLLLIKARRRGKKGTVESRRGKKRDGDRGNVTT
jgi:hypothetical protein